MPQSDAYRDYQFAWGILRDGKPSELEELSQLDDSFPFGSDRFLFRRWIINAIDSESLESVRWMLAKGVELRFRDDEGYTPLHSALECAKPVRYQLLRELLAGGADVNLKGINDYTPTHLAAARDDVDALKILVEHGADLSIRTEIDDYATPLQEAKLLNRVAASEYLQSVA